MEKSYVKKRVLDRMIDKRVAAERDMTTIVQIVGVTRMEKLHENGRYML